MTAHTDAELEKNIRGIAKAAPIRNLFLKCGVYCCENASLPVSAICNRAFLALNSIKDDMNHAVARFDDPINQRICREPEQAFLDYAARWHESGDDCGLQIKCALRV